VGFAALVRAVGRRAAAAIWSLPSANEHVQEALEGVTVVSDGDDDIEDLTEGRTGLTPPSLYPALGRGGETMAPDVEDELESNIRLVRMLRKQGVNVQVVQGAGARLEVQARCQKPGCLRRVFVEPDGREHQYCGRSHATEHQRDMSVAALVADVAVPVAAAVSSSVGSFALHVPAKLESLRKSVLRCAQWIRNQVCARREGPNGLEGAKYESKTSRCVLCNQPFEIGVVIVKCFVAPNPVCVWVHLMCVELIVLERGLPTLDPLT